MHCTFGTLHSITGAIFFSSFSVRKKRQKLIQGRCDVLENPGDASRLVLGIFLFHYRTFCHRKNGLRYGVLCYIKQRLFAKVMFSADAIVQTCTFIVETLTHFVLNQPQLVGGLGFHLNCPLLHLNTKTEICTKRFMGPGGTRLSRRKRDVNCGLIKNINGTKSKLS